MYEETQHITGSNCLYKGNAVFIRKYNFTSIDVTSKVLVEMRRVCANFSIDRSKKFNMHILVKLLHLKPRYSMVLVFPFP